LTEIRTRFVADASTDPNAETPPLVSQAFGHGVFTALRFRDNVRLYVDPSRLVEVLGFLKSRCGLSFLVELGGADYLNYPGHPRGRYEVHYVLRNLDTGETLVVKVDADDPDPSLPTVTPLWPGADWMEREVFDMYGVKFEGHPDLRRILMPEGFTAFPLRKDYPLRGRGERHNFPRLTRGQS